MSKPWPTAARSRSSGLVARHVDHDRPRHRVAGHRTSAHRRRDAGRPPSAERSAPPSFSRVSCSRRRREMPRGSKTYPGSIEQAYDAYQRMAVGRRRDLVGQRAPDAAEPRGARRRCAAPRAAGRRRSSTAETRRGRGAPPPRAWSRRHRERDVPLRRSLRDRDDVDAACRERREHARGNARRCRPCRRRRPRSRPCRAARSRCRSGPLASSSRNARRKLLDRARALPTRRRVNPIELSDERLEDRRDRQPLGLDRARTSAPRCRARRPCPCRRP